MTTVRTARAIQAGQLLMFEEPPAPVIVPVIRAESDVAAHTEDARARGLARVKADAGRGKLASNSDPAFLAGVAYLVDGANWQGGANTLRAMRERWHAEGYAPEEWTKGLRDFAGTGGCSGRGDGLDVWTDSKGVRVGSLRGEGKSFAWARIAAVVGERLDAEDADLEVLEGEAYRFKAGDLVRLGGEPPGFGGTVYTVAGILPGSRGWVVLREYANPVGPEGLRLAYDASGPSLVFPDELPNPGLTDKKLARLEHRLSDGGLIRHLDDAEWGQFCSVCHPDKGVAEYSEAS